MAGQFKFDVYFYYTWRDDRKAAMANSTNIYDIKNGDNFSPKPEIMNMAEDKDLTIYCYMVKDGSPSYVEGLSAREREGIWINCISRLRMTLDADLILKAYPWDTQRAFVTFESSESVSEDLIWVASSAADLMPPSGPNAVSGWKITSTGYNTDLHVYPALKETYSSLTYWITIERIPDYFIVRVPSCLVLLKCGYLP